MAGLALRDTRTNVLIAAAIAHRNGGYFHQNEPPGWLAVESEGALTIERDLIFQALGRPCSDETWEALVDKPTGRVAVMSADLIVIE